MAKERRWLVIGRYSEAFQLEIVNQKLDEVVETFVAFVQEGQSAIGRLLIKVFRVALKVRG